MGKYFVVDEVVVEKGDCYRIVKENKRLLAC